jgi:hypothetical protein
MAITLLEFAAGGWPDIPANRMHYRPLAIAGEDQQRPMTERWRQAGRYRQIPPDAPFSRFGQTLALGWRSSAHGKRARSNAAAPQ